MDNIKKIIISFDNDNNLSKVVVVKNNKIERYNNKNYSLEELLDIYIECVNNLEKQYVSKLEGLSVQEKINKLGDLNVIETNNDELIEGLTVFEEPEKFVVDYESSKKEVIESVVGTDEYLSEYRSVIIKLCNTYGITMNNYDETLENLKKLGLYSEKEKELNLPMVIQENKVSNLSVRKKWILALLGTGAIATLAYCGIKSLKNNQKNDDKDNNYTIDMAIPGPTEELQPTQTPYIENTEELPVLVIEEPTPTPEIKYPEIYYEQEEMNHIDYFDAANNTILMMSVNETSIYGPECSFEQMMETRNSNMDSLENHIQGSLPILGEGYYVYFENLFNNSTLYDKAFVRYFSIIGNRIIKNGYKDNNFDLRTGVNRYAKMSCYEVVRCIRDDEPIVVWLNGERYEIQYSGLSNKAKEVVLNIVWSNYTALNSYPREYQEGQSDITEIEYNGETITKADIADIIMTAYEELSMTK